MASEADVQRASCRRFAWLARTAPDAVVCAAGCCGLAESVPRLATSEDVHAAVKALLAALRAYPASVCVQRAACCALAHWCDDFPEACALAGAAGAIDAVVAGLQTHVETESVATAACFALGAVFGLSTANRRLEPVGAVLAAMRKHPSHPEVQGEGCYALQRVSAVRGDYCDAAVGLGALELLVASLSHTDVLGIYNGLQALANLVFASSESANRAHRCGAVAAIIKAMHDHQAQAAMQSVGCLALSNMMCECDASVAEAVRLNAPAVIIAALRSYPDNNQLQANACNALAALSNVAGLPRQTVPDNTWHADAVFCVVRALKTHAADADVQQLACSALTNLTHAQPVNIADARRLGALPCFLRRVAHTFPILWYCLSASKHFNTCCLVLEQPF